MAERISYTDRIISALSYLTAGWVGFFYCIYLIFSKKKVSYFLRFNVYQSLFIAIVFFLLSVIFGFIFKILSMIPLIQIIISWIQLILFRPMIFQYSLIQAFVTGIIVYGFVFSILARFPRIFWVSKIIDYNIKR